jgi:hypothetical protein
MNKLTKSTKSRAPTALTVFGHSNTVVLGSNPTQIMDMCVYSLFVFFCMYVAALRRADPPSKESYRFCID